MNNKQMILATLGIFFCLAEGAAGQAQVTPTKVTLPDEYGGTRVLPVLTPALKARLDQKGRLDQAAVAALNAGAYAEAEDESRQSLALGIGSGVCQELLAMALNAQGKDQEALQMYKTIADQGDVFPRNLVPYALLLLKDGQWAKAVSVYNQVLPELGNEQLARVGNRFTADVPQPKELMVTLRIAQGITDDGDFGWERRSGAEAGLGEFAQAVRLAPGSALTNYYYGYGWQHLPLKSRARALYAARAKAAFQKAAFLDGGGVKRDAEAALSRIRLSELNQPE